MSWRVGLRQTHTLPPVHKLDINNQSVNLQRHILYRESGILAQWVLNQNAQLAVLPPAHLCLDRYVINTKVCFQLVHA